MTKNSSNKTKLTSDRIADLSPEKRALLALQLKQKTIASPAQQSIPRRNNDGPLPLSFAQQRLWLLNQLDPDSPVYNMPKAVQINGPLQVDILHQTLEAIITRHTTLRTTFRLIDNDPRQIVSKDWSLNLPVISLSHLPQANKDDEVERLLNEHIIKPFDLTRDLLLRPLLIQIEPEAYILLLVTHHIASDGWSRNILFQEISALYSAFSKGEATSLPELPIQYTDFALWQREQLQGEALERQLTYWREQLRDAPPILELPTDHPRKKVKTSFGGRQSITFPKTLYDSLKALSKQHNATLFMTLLAAFKALLYRYTAQEHMVVGTPIANRTHLEIEDLIGFFVNTLVLHTDLSGNPTFQEVLARVREVALGAYAHQDLPFEKLVEKLQPERALNHNPLFQVMFAFQNAPKQALESAGLTMDSLAVESELENFDLTLSIVEGAAGLQGSLTYNADLFDVATIERMMGHFQVLLMGIVANPKTPISQLPLLTETERHQLLVEWNDTTADYPLDQCIHQLFETQVERTPDAIAVVYEDQQLTYRELNNRANQLAHYLKKDGVGPDILVGICFERSLELVVGLLGILKAGGAYVPLDPTYPKERLAFMIEDTQMPLLLTQERLLKSLPKHKAQVICLDSNWEDIAQEYEENLTSGVTVKNPVYVIYTSGSTGRPKGVLIPHKALINHNVTIINDYGLCPSDRILQFASISFDVAAEELFPSLLSGATVVLRSDQVLTSFTDFLQFVEKENLTVLNLPTSYWQEWVSDLSDSKAQLPSTLRLVIVGSEKANPAKLILWQEIVGKRVRWINGYGPTEATITTMIYEPDDSQENHRGHTIPIGRPIANTQIYLLDQHLAPVPIGIPGELHIGGASLAQGYLNRPELTAEKFIQNPFGDEPGRRLYKTGDLARYLPDGNIEFLGRVDHQVKIRGFRVELGEIEAVLDQHPAVREVVITVREDIPGDKRLAAYLVLNQDESATVNELRRYVREKLPDYMTPSIFMVLEALPLTPNGKLDRQALPAPQTTRPELVEAFVAPEGPVEEMLAEIWQKVLKVDKIGINDNFFELGGHSLLAVQVVSRLLADYEVELPLYRLFDTPTIAELAPIIEEILFAEIEL